MISSYRLSLVNLKESSGASFEFENPQGFVGLLEFYEKELSIPKLWSHSKTTSFDLIILTCRPPKEAWYGRSKFGIDEKLMQRTR